MLILWKARQKDPTGGYARTFVDPDGAGAGHAAWTAASKSSPTRADSTRPGWPNDLSELAARLGPAPQGRLRRTATTWPTGSPSSITAGHPLTHLDTGQTTRRGRRNTRHRQRLPRRVGDHRRAAGRGRHRDLPARHRRLAGRRPRRVVARLASGTTRRARRGGRRRPRHRVRPAGHRRQLLLAREHSWLDEISRPALPRLPDRRGGRTTAAASSPSTRAPAVWCRAAPSPLSCCTRSPSPPTATPTSSRTSTRCRLDAMSARTGSASGERAAAHHRPDTQGRDQLPRWLPQHHDAGADRARHRGRRPPGPSSSCSTSSAGVDSSRDVDVRLIRYDQPGRPDQRAGHRAPADNGQGPRPGQGGSAILQCSNGTRARRLRGIPHHHPAHRRKARTASTGPRWSRPRCSMQPSCCRTAPQPCPVAPPTAPPGRARLRERLRPSTIAGPLPTARRPGLDDQRQCGRSAGSAPPAPATRAATPMSECGRGTRRRTRGYAST